MDASLAVQYVVIAVAVVVSAWVVLKKQFPGPLRKARIALALPLLREGKPGWMQALGRRVAPAPQGQADAACGGCSSCGPDDKKA
ncbi:DUF6587 family protein [Pseudoxanthomonas sp.]|uniref:DUF6587 family protein n=1 Tax=Pseudoxanthomonas sp. TaxID=1871049 RepID=UPI002FE27682